MQHIGPLRERHCQDARQSSAVSILTSALALLLAGIAHDCCERRQDDAPMRLKINYCRGGMLRNARSARTSSVTAKFEGAIFTPPRAHDF